MLRPFPIRRFLVLEIGIIEKAIEGDRPGRIRYYGTSWFAKPYVLGLDLKFFTGQQVEVCARQGNTLLILPSIKQILSV
ncbi:MAG: NfeD family protein [Elainellaceae cyanobacterium]